MWMDGQSFSLHQQNRSETQHYRVAVCMDGQSFSLYQQNRSETTLQSCCGVCGWMDSHLASISRIGQRHNTTECCGVCGWMDSHLASISRIGQRHNTTELLWCVWMDGQSFSLHQQNRSETQHYRVAVVCVDGWTPRHSDREEQQQADYIHVPCPQHSPRLSDRYCKVPGLELDDALRPQRQGRLGTGWVPRTSISTFTQLMSSDDEPT